MKSPCIFNYSWTYYQIGGGIPKAGTSTITQDNIDKENNISTPTSSATPITPIFANAHATAGSSKTVEAPASVQDPSSSTLPTTPVYVSTPSASDAPTEASAANRPTTRESSNAYDTLGSANTAGTPVSAPDPLIVRTPSNGNPPSKAFETFSPPIVEEGQIMMYSKASRYTTFASRKNQRSAKPRFVRLNLCSKRDFSPQKSVTSRLLF